MKPMMGEQETIPKVLLNRSGRLEDSYIVGVLIGRGSYSMLHKCLYKGKVQRACKVYKKTHVEPSLVVSHVESLLKLSHPNLCARISLIKAFKEKIPVSCFNIQITVHDVFETGLELQVVTDLATGEELLERIERSDHYSEREAALAIRTLLSALQYLHTQGLPHGSILPENIIYESEAPNAKLKLSEIAMPKISQSPIITGIYSAPNFHTEMSLQSFRCSSDIWSLGILIYIMLCGLEPTMEELSAQMQGEVEGEWTDVSASARNLITRLLQKDSSLRLTAEQALQHPWVCGDAVATRHMLDAQERLKSFNARRKLRATAHAIIATQRAMSIVKPFRTCQATR